MSEQPIHDSEEEDSDYVQEGNDDDGDDDGKDQDQVDESMGNGIAAHKRSAVDTLWAEMNAKDVTPAGVRSGGVLSGERGKAKHAKKKSMKKANKVLSGIFGKKAASNIVAGAGKPKDKKRKSPGGSGKSGGENRAKVLAASRTVEVSEVKKYAGQEILVKRTVTAGSAQHSNAARIQKKAGIDNVLAALDGPKAISTVAKSSMDWDTYKVAEGIEGEMDQATKDGKGYLNKQDFLQRCDVRRFEHELEARQAKRDV